MKDNMMTLTEVIELGFTKTMVNKLLPEPIIKPNRSHPRSPLKLFDCDVVNSVMQTDAYAELKTKADKRREAAAIAVETKTKNLYNLIMRPGAIHVTVMRDDRLRMRVIDAKFDWYERNGNYCDYLDPDEATMQRWCVNYIRHNLIDYDKAINATTGKVGKDYVYYTYKEKVLSAIAVAYPQYADECERQLGYSLNNVTKSE